MKKQMICALLAMMVLAGCSGGGQGGGDGTGSGTVSGTATDEPVTAGTSETTADERIPVSPGNDEGTETTGYEELPELPEIPEGGVTGMTGAVMFSNDEIVIHAGESGSKYVNGEPFPNNVADSMLQQVLNPSEESTKTTGSSVTTTRESSAPSETTTTKGVIHIPVEPDMPDLPTLTENITVEQGGDIFYLAKYVVSEDTELDITAINVFSSGRPGVKGVDAFKPGETMLINLTCNTEAAPDATMYIVRESIEHKDSYLDVEVLDTVNMIRGFETGEGQFFVEYTLPSSIDSDVYELRFCLDGEEGYIPFYFG